MKKDFRQNKYLNESGSKQGTWYINRMDYFQFHNYPKANQHKFTSFIVAISAFCLALKFASISFLLLGLFLYITYVAALTFILLKNRLCRYKGDFLYPKRIISFFRSIEITVDLNDFDSIATMSKK